ncbi:CDP-glycerol glycerophosphotransferase family protein, partial [Microvirga sp. 3-52]|nr:CDP-glycerol glycerophosphotransferase family protein [Microvirga sp. 3-52]
MLTKIKKSKITLSLFKIVFLALGLLPKKKDLIIFESFHGKQYSDSPRSIYEYLAKKHPNYKLVWSIDRGSVPLFTALGIPYVKRFSPKWFLMKPRAKYWVNNVRLPIWMPRPKGTTYLQTWHGTPLKK